MVSSGDVLMDREGWQCGAGPGSKSSALSTPGYAAWAHFHVGAGATSTFEGGIYVNLV